MTSFDTARRRMIHAKGDSMTLRRLSKPSNLNLPVIGFLSAFSDRELGIGGVEQGDARVAITNDELATAGSGFPAPPRTGDVMLIGERAWRVIGASEVVVRDDLIGWNLWIRGG